MMTRMDNVDLHLSQLATWLVRTVGSALLWATFIPLVLGAIVLGVKAPEMLWLAIISGPLVFGWRLAAAEAPMPAEMPVKIPDE